MSRKEVGSIYDLAKRTGVSSGTISRVLNNRKGVAPRTRKRVLDAVKHAKFRPRMSAKPVTVAVVADRVRYVVYGGYLSCLITFIVDELAKRDVAVEMYTEHNVDRIGDRYVDGVLAMTWDEATIHRLQSLSTPVVLLNRTDLPEFSNVASDHYQSGMLAADYFLDRGHQRVGFLGIGNDWGARERIRGFKDSFARRNLEFEESLIGLTQHQPIYATLRNMISRQPTAMFLFSEDLVLEAAFVLTNVMNLKIPDDISIIGMENPKVSQFLNPPHTSISQPLDKIAGQAMGLLMRLIDEAKTEPEQILLPNELIERESVRTIAAS
jgi:DNA-binding LacI/PurR family transcriptional regulator